MTASDGVISETIDYIRRFTEGQVAVFVPFLDGDTWGIGVAILGKSGYITNMLSEHFATEEAAAGHAGKLNAAVGYSQETVDAVIADTMRRSNALREAADEIVTLKLTREQLQSVRMALQDGYAVDDEAFDLISEALDSASEDFKAISKRHASWS
jgi:hypothetical protein